MLFAARLLGHPVLLYDGSFEDWSRRDLPGRARCDPMNAPRPYANPHVAGVGLGLVLLACFVTDRARPRRLRCIRQRQRPASSHSWHRRTPLQTSTSAGYLDAGGFTGNWLVFELLGVLIGAAVSAWLGGRWRAEVDRGPRLAIRRAAAVAAWRGCLDGRRRHARARLHQRPGTQWRRPAQRRQLDLHAQPVRQRLPGRTRCCAGCGDERFTRHGRGHRPRLRRRA